MIVNKFRAEVFFRGHNKNENLSDMSNPDDGLAPSGSQDQFLNEERNVNEQVDANVENNEEEELEINNVNEAYDNQAFVDLDEYINDDAFGSANSDDEFHSAEEENNFESMLMIVYF